MDFALTTEQQTMMGELDKLARQQFAPKAFSWNDEVPWPNLRMLADRGYLGLCLPLVVGIALTEAQAGSDVSGLAASAETHGDTVVINGTKLYTSHAMVAGVFVVFLRLDGAYGSILVERDAPGLTIGPPDAWMSGERYCTLTFDHCEVPVGNVMVSGSSLRDLMNEYLVERLGNSARAVGVARLALEVAEQHIQGRRPFGSRLV